MNVTIEPEGDTADLVRQAQAGPGGGPPAPAGRLHGQLLGMRAHPGWGGGDDPRRTRITSYSWDLGDGVPVEGSRTLHTFPPGRHVVTLTVTNDLGLVSTKHLEVSCGCPDADATPWTPIDIGDPLPAIFGSAHSTGAEPRTLEVCAGGRGISGTQDSFHLDYQELSGDGALVARLRALEGENGARVGLMLREDLDPGSRHAAIIIQNGTPNDLCRFLHRATKDASLGPVIGSTETPELPDAWLKLERAGNTLIGSLSNSPDEPASWTEVGRKDFLPELPPRLFAAVCAAGADRGRTPFHAVKATLTDISSTFTSAKPLFRRGDCNDDGGVDISDAVCLLTWLFVGGPAPGCIAVTNTNGDAVADIADAVFVLGFLFLGGPAPSEPFPDCGLGNLPADEDLGCQTPPRSCSPG